MRRLIGAERQGRKRRQCVRVGDDEVGRAGVVDAPRAGVEREPGGDLGVAAQRTAEPDGAVFVEQGERDGARPWPSAAGGSPGPATG